MTSYAEAEAMFLAQGNEVLSRVARVKDDLARLRRIRAGLETPRGRAFAIANTEATMAAAEGYQRYLHELEAANSTLSDCIEQIAEYRGPEGSGTAPGFGFLGIAIVALIGVLGVAAAYVANSVARVREAEVERDRLDLIEQGVIEPIPYKTLLIVGGALLLISGGTILKRRRSKRRKAAG